nr:TetR/AcrR family transcriptional regulator C-terminal domain-containing protein [bacterium]
MNKSESKYFNTAARMDEAFLALLEHKDFAYITIKEVCGKAGVNRSTFYLHYETLADLLAESIQYLNNQFLAYFKGISDGAVTRLQDCPLDELYFVTPTYLTPYFTYIKDHKRLFQTAVENTSTLQLDKTYDKLFINIFSPILERHQVPAQGRAYIMAFYIHGLMAIVTQWLKDDCAVPIDHMIAIMQQCVMPHQESEEKK